MKHRIFIMMYYMNCGGVEIALTELLKRIDPKMYDVHILFLEKKGAFLERIPPWVTTSELQISAVEKELLTGLSIRATVKLGLRTGRLLKTVKIFCKYLHCKLTRDPAPAYSAVFHRGVLFNCDIAMDFHGYMSLTTFFVAEKVQASKKYTWVHAEPIAQNLAHYQKYLKKFDKIFCVSDQCKKLAMQSLPCFGNDAIELFKNFIDTSYIAKSAIVGNKLPNKIGCVTLLTVGRLSQGKGYDVAIRIAKKLKENHLCFQWFFCGDGELRPEIERDIQLYKLEGNLILLGFQENPYGYMASCDIYVQPSKSEGYALAVAEAFLLKAPIVSTPVPAAKELIINGVNGYVVNNDEDAFFNSIRYLIENPEVRKGMRNQNTITKNLNSDSQKKLNEILQIGCANEFPF